MPQRIFISYRREDGAATARSICERLSNVFGGSNVFMDVHSLVAGQRFDKELNAALDKCAVFISVIGPRWMEILKKREADGEHDYVRFELASALRRNMVVIPALVEGARLPPAASLPADLNAVVMHQKQEVSHERFHHDLADLVRAVEVATGGPRSNYRFYAMAAAGVLVAALALWQVPWQRIPGIFGPAKQETNNPPPKTQNRWIKVQNNSKARSIRNVYAVPAHMRATIIQSGDWLGTTAVVPPGGSLNVNFDDGRGTCEYDIRAVSDQASTEWVWRKLNVCTQEMITTTD